MTLKLLPTPPSSPGGESKKKDQDASNATKAEAVNAQEAKTLQVTSETSGVNSEEVRGHLQAEGTPAEKKPDVRSSEAQPGSSELSSGDSCGVPAGDQKPDLSQCHEYYDNSQEFAAWKGSPSSQPGSNKSGPPPYLRGYPTGYPHTAGQSKH